MNNIKINSFYKTLNRQKNINYKLDIFTKKVNF